MKINCNETLYFLIFIFLIILLSSLLLKCWVCGRPGSEEVLPVLERITALDQPPHCSFTARLPQWPLPVFHSLEPRLTYKSEQKCENAQMTSEDFLAHPCIAHTSNHACEHWLNPGSCCWVVLSPVWIPYEWECVACQDRQSRGGGACLCCMLLFFPCYCSSIYCIQWQTLDPYWIF